MAVRGVEGKREGNLLVQNCGKNSEERHAKDETEDELPTEGKSGAPYHGNWDCNESNVGADIETHLQDAVVLVGRALHICDRHSPVLVERAAEDSIVCDFNDDKSESNIT